MAEKDAGAAITGTQRSKEDGTLFASPPAEVAGSTPQKYRDNEEKCFSKVQHPAIEPGPVDIMDLTEPTDIAPSVHENVASEDSAPSATSTEKELTMANRDDDDDDDEEEEEEEEEESSRIVCIECGEFFDNMEVLQEHLRRKTQWGNQSVSLVTCNCL